MPAGSRTPVLAVRTVETLSTSGGTHPSSANFENESSPAVEFEAQLWTNVETQPIEDASLEGSR